MTLEERMVKHRINGRVDLLAIELQRITLQSRLSRATQTGDALGLIAALKNLPKENRFARMEAEYMLDCETEERQRKQKCVTKIE